MKTPSWFLKRNFIAYALWPLSVIYLLFSKLVFFIRKLCAIRPANTGVFIICVGGVMAGGVGKTPIVREIAKNIPNSCVVMRGYGGRKSGRVTNRDTAETVGDEAKMLSLAEIPVFVGPNRNDGIKSAKKAGFSTIIMDDGFQNPTFKKDISILVFDGLLGVGNGFILPAGPLREDIGSATRRADVCLVVNPNKGRLDWQKVLKKPVFYAHTESQTNGLSGRYVAFSGLGYPHKFFDSIEKKVNLVKKIPFPDHHNFTDGDLKMLESAGKMNNAGLITTEKDWVRLPKSFQKHILIIHLKTMLDVKFLDLLKKGAKNGN